MNRAVVLAVPVLLGLSACAAPSATSDDGIAVVASTDVWASVAAAVGGDRIQVTAIIDSPDKDPHEYEATARDQLAVSRADLVIENGGGYDPFIDTLLEASGADPAVVNAVEVSGLAPEEESADEHAEDEEHGEHEHIEGFNEHVWYSLDAAAAVAEQVAQELTRIDPDGDDVYSAGLAGFLDQLEPVQAELDALHVRAEGTGVLVTETVPSWLLASAGFADLTPAEFAEAVEEDRDVAPAVLQEVLDILSSGDAVLLGYNEQAATGQTDIVRDAAEQAGVAVVSFSETLPEGEDYITWMAGNVERLAAAVPE